MLNKQKGNMYGFVTHTWNPIRGECPHACSYCYMKVFKNLGELRLDEKSLRDDLGKGNYIFVGSSCDMWAKKVPSWWIGKVIEKCLEHKENKYLFQTKDPRRFAEFMGSLSFLDCILGITIETNRIIPKEISKAPSIKIRVDDFQYFKEEKKMVTIEPIMDFDIVGLTRFINIIKPDFVNIGADSKGHNLPEPSKEKIEQLIKELKKFTKVKLKDNLKRLMK